MLFNVRLKNKGGGGVDSYFAKQIMTNLLAHSFLPIDYYKRENE
jgi:hypothetical protein